MEEDSGDLLYPENSKVNIRKIFESDFSFNQLWKFNLFVIPIFLIFVYNFELPLLIYGFYLIITELVLIRIIIDLNTTGPEYEEYIQKREQSHLYWKGFSRR